MAKTLHNACRRIMSPVLKQRGFAISQVLDNWPEIIGQDIAKYVKPITIKWHNRTNMQTEELDQETSGILHITCPAAMSIDIQHRNREIISKVNMVFGYTAISSLKIQHVALSPRAKPRKRKVAPPKAVEIDFAETTDDRLKEALASLGGHVVGRGE